MADAVGLAFRRANLADLWDRLARAYGERTAFTLEEPLRLHVLHARELSYQDVADVVARLAGALARCGVRPGSRVAICTENRIDYALTIFAVVRAGGIAVPLHHHLTRDEVAAAVRRARARFLVADPPVAVRLARVRTLSTERGGALDRACAEADALAAAAIAPDDPAVILYTSGTTGVPKGATLTSRSLLAVAKLAALVPEAHRESGICGLPLAHVMGLSTLLCAALAGAPMHWLTKFDAKRVLERIVERRPTFFIGVPAMYALLAEQDPERYDLSSIKLFASGADAMPPALLERFRVLGCALASPLGQRLLTAAFAEVYGMVELSGPAILKLTPATPPAGARVSASLREAAVRARSMVAVAAARLGIRFAGRGAGVLPGAGAGAGAAASEPPSRAVGIPIPPYRARVVDESGRPVKAGVVGELVLKGPGVTKGYDADPEATSRTTRDGWLYTGDLARKSRLGLIAFVSRKKDVVKHGGFSVFPAEVEAQLAHHPAVAEAVVFGAPHRTKGAVPVAAIVLKKGKKASEHDLLAWSREHIARFKAPRAIAVVAAAEVPRNANRKVLKDALRDALLPRLQKQLAEAEKHRNR